MQAKNFSRFLCIARGSVYELETQLEISYSVGYTTQEKIEPIINLCKEVSKMLNALNNTLL